VHRGGAENFDRIAEWHAERRREHLESQRFGSFARLKARA
jgi:hypothetical protein